MKDIDRPVSAGDLFLARLAGSDDANKRPIPAHRFAILLLPLLLLLLLVLFLLLLTTTWNCLMHRVVSKWRTFITVS